MLSPLFEFFDLSYCFSYGHGISAVSAQSRPVWQFLQADRNADAAVRERASN
jgi:hypothetical protein